MFDTYLRRAEPMFNTISGHQNNERENLPLLIGATMAAKTLGISPRSLWTLTKAGTISHVRLGRRVMYSPQCLQEAVATNTFVGGIKNGERI
jgi:hypothetical protein